MAYFNERLADFFKEPKESLQKIRDLEFTSDIVCVDWYSKNIFFGVDKTFYKLLPGILIGLDSNFFTYNMITYVDGTLPTLREQEEEKLREFKRKGEQRILKKYEGNIRKKLKTFSHIELEEIADMLDRVRMKFIYDMEPRQRSDYFDSKRREREERKRKKREQLIKKGIPIHDPPPGYNGLSAFFGD